MDTGKPIFSKDSVKYNQFTVVLKNPFSDDNGLVESYTVLVAGDKFGLSATAKNTKTWAEVKGTEEWDAYQVFPACSNLFSEGKALKLFAV